MTPTKDQIVTLLNNLNVGTNKAKLGEMFVALLDRVEELEGAEPGAAVSVDTLGGATAFGKSLMKAADQAAAKILLGIA